MVNTTFNPEKDNVLPKLDHHVKEQQLNEEEERVKTLLTCPQYSPLKQELTELRTSIHDAARYCQKMHRSPKQSSIDKINDKIASLHFKMRKIDQSETIKFNEYLVQGRKDPIKMMKEASKHSFTENQRRTIAFQAATIIDVSKFDDFINNLDGLNLPHDQKLDLLLDIINERGRPDIIELSLKLYQHLKLKPEEKLRFLDQLFDSHLSYIIIENFPKFDLDETQRIAVAKKFISHGLENMISENFAKFQITNQEECYQLAIKIFPRKTSERTDFNLLKDFKLTPAQYQDVVFRTAAQSPEKVFFAMQNGEINLSQSEKYDLARLILPKCREHFFGGDPFQGFELTDQQKVEVEFLIAVQGNKGLEALFADYAIENDHEKLAIGELAVMQSPQMETIENASAGSPQLKIPLFFFALTFNPSLIDRLDEIIPQKALQNLLKSDAMRGFLLRQRANQALLRMTSKEEEEFAQLKEKVSGIIMEHSPLQGLTSLQPMFLEKSIKATESFAELYALAQKIKDPHSREMALRWLGHYDLLCQSLSIPEKQQKLLLPLAKALLDLRDDSLRYTLTGFLFIHIHSNGTIGIEKWTKIQKIMPAEHTILFKLLLLHPAFTHMKNNRTAMLKLFNSKEYRNGLKLQPTLKGINDILNNSYLNDQEKGQLLDLVFKPKTVQVPATAPTNAESVAYINKNLGLISSCLKSEIYKIKDAANMEEIEKIYQEKLNEVIGPNVNKEKFLSLRNSQAFFLWHPA